MFGESGSHFALSLTNVNQSAFDAYNGINKIVRYASESVTNVTLVIIRSGYGLHRDNMNASIAS